ncbi:hypothetical protein IW262DRAFT_1467537 [Armillaria fumosa]|nr:hypothetical protein IW262DRAFT_1467537 [Armillaria fumosa]
MSTSVINQTNSARPYCRSAYIDPCCQGQPCTFSSMLLSYTSSSEIIAKSVIWQANTTDSEHTITVNKEVTLSPPPHIMFLSGIGPFSVLQAASIDVILDLPDVRQNVKNHIDDGIDWAAQETITMSIENSKSDLSKTAVWLSFILDAIAYVNFTTLMGDDMTTWISAICNDYAVSESYIPSTDLTILAGYRGTFKVLTQTYYRTEYWMVREVAGPRNRHPRRFGLQGSLSATKEAYTCANNAPQRLRGPPLTLHDKKSLAALPSYLKLNAEFPLLPLPFLRSVAFTLVVCLLWVRWLITIDSEAQYGHFRPSRTLTRFPPFSRDDWTTVGATANLETMATSLQDSWYLGRDAEIVGDIAYDPNVHGTSGPSIPRIELLNSNSTETGRHPASLWGESLPRSSRRKELGVTLMSTSVINPTNSARPYSRSVYIDTLPPRSNLHIPPDAMVVRINRDISSSEIKAKGVVWQADTTDCEHMITINK